MAGTANIQQVEVFVGTVVTPAVASTTQYASSAVMITGASASQSSTVTFGTPTTPAIVADLSTVTLTLNATAITGTPPPSVAGLPLAGQVQVGSINIGRVEPDSATAANRTVNTIVSIPIMLAVDANGAVKFPASGGANIAATIGRGEQYNVDFGAFVTVNIVLASWVTNLTYSWSMYGKT